ncbi:hypothetical protein [uncultured Chryseobacterium sp.]|uniref:hypothetical protein n=1 Tax=uncultured Chryseobacterium sp. TaxID=259322 RepID=UPI0025E84219|nr:hypothetical protein [uncultured Chryseobacterium sp.]
MITLQIDETKVIFFTKLLQCWFLRKFDGGKSYKNGHHCGDKICVICNSSINIEKGLPIKFTSFVKKNLNKIICGSPTEIFEINKQFKKIKFGKKDQKKINLFLKKTGYENWFQPNYSKEFLDILNIDTCVYCNKNYTLNILDNFARAELDHWFPKNVFPLLSLSLYNLIPSCHSCNHIKGSPQYDWENALNELNHPYQTDKNESFIFSYEYSHDLQSLKVVTKVPKSALKTPTTLKFNNIEEIYNAHSNKELKDLLDLRYKYSDKFLEMVITNFGVMTKQEAYRIVFGIEMDTDNYHKRPFSKFKKDILDELLSK